MLKFALRKVSLIKLKIMITLRVYDIALRNKKYSNYIDRFTLYVPTPRNKVNEWGYMGIYLGFSFGHEQIIRCCWDECKYGVATMNLGRKVKRESLPQYVQRWVNKMEEAYNKALKEDTKEAWENWYKA